MTRWLFGAMCLFVVPAVAAPPAPAPFEFRTVALSEQQAPGTEPGVRYGGLDISTAQINAAGQVVFETSPLVGPGVTSANDYGIFAGAPGAVGLVARSGTQAPDLPTGVIYQGFVGDAARLINGQGQLAFGSQLAGPGISPGQAAVFEGPAGSVRLLAAEGGAAPGFDAGVAIAVLSHITDINDAGAVLFSGRVSGPGITATNDRVMWVGTPGNLTVVARRGDRAPGTGGGVTFDDLYGIGARLNNNGLVGFASGLANGVNGTNNRALFVGRPGALQLVARLGDPAAGVAGTAFSNMDTPALNDSGRFVFHGAAGQKHGIWAGAPGSLQLVALGGESAPGTPAGVTYADVRFAQPVIGPSGMVAFQSGLQGSGVGPNDVGIWAGQPGALHLVARTGDGVPAAGQDAQFDFLWPNLMINSSDALLFESTLKGSGISDANDTALFLATPGAVPVMVVREGDGIDVGNGDVRIIRELGTGGGRESYLLNDAGQVAFRATFTDGSSGVFVTVPEPSAAAIAVTGLTLAGLRRQRRR